MDGYDPNKQFTWYLIFVYENKNPDPNTMDLIDALFSQSLYTLLNTSIQQNRYAALSSFFFFFFLNPWIGNGYIYAIGGPI